MYSISSLRIFMCQKFHCTTTKVTVANCFFWEHFMHRSETNCLCGKPQKTKTEKSFQHTAAKGGGTAVAESRRVYFYGMNPTHASSSGQNVFASALGPTAAKLLGRTPHV